MDSLGSDTGVGLLSSGFESALLPCKFLVFRLEHMPKHMGFLLRTVICSLGTRGGALVSAVSRDTHDCGFWSVKELAWTLQRKEGKPLISTKSIQQPEKFADSARNSERVHWRMRSGLELAQVRGRHLHPSHRSPSNLFCAVCQL
jgi:hypothetical protein